VCASVEEEGEVGLEAPELENVAAAQKSVDAASPCRACAPAISIWVCNGRGFIILQKTALTFDNVPRVQHLINGARSLGEGIS